MALQCSETAKDEIKTSFVTREGNYKLMTSAEYSRPNRLSYTSQGNNTPVTVSFVTLPGPASSGASSLPQSHSNNCDSTSSSPIGQSEKICFNIGRELYVYTYKGVKKAADLSKPVDKRIYKGTYPTCHDFNCATAESDAVHLLVGFSAGQIQLIDPIKKELSKLFNEERLIDKTKVTCIKWVPNSSNQFLVSHSSGQMYVYKEDLPCGSAPPHYQMFKQGEGFNIHTCKTKSTRNPTFRWVIGEGSLNEFQFSPCGKYLATVSQDGFLRVFNYDTMELIGRMRSYFGGLLCVCWSHDGKFIVTGGEDDLVTVWSFVEKRVVARGEGHESWVSVVAFDEYTTSYGDILDLNGSDEELAQHCAATTLTNDANAVMMMSNNGGGSKSAGASHSHSIHTNDSLNRNMNCKPHSNATNNSSGHQMITCYRFGSVGQDTHLCLWDLTDDVLKQPVGRSRTSILVPSPSTQLSSIASTGSGSNALNSNALKVTNMNNVQANSVTKESNAVAMNADGNLLPQLHANRNASSDKSHSDKKDHKRNFSLGSRNNDKNSVNKASQSTKHSDDAVKLLGTAVCPRLDEVPMLEPLVCKKIAQERLTSLVFRSDCFVTACQEGYVCTWARPGKWGNSQLISSPSPSFAAEVNEMLGEDDDGGSTIV